MRISKRFIITKFISKLFWGTKTPEGVRPVNEKWQIKAVYDKKMKNGNAWTKPIKNQDLIEHCNNERTLYFTGSDDRNVREILIMIDIDCHKFGTKEGAWEFAKYLKANFFPNLYLEASTNGIGVHGYMIIDRYTFSAIQIGEAFNESIQPYLRKLAAPFVISGKISDVEIKGLPGHIKWGNKKYQINDHDEDIKSGTLAKIPRGLFTRNAELAGTYKTDIVSLRDLAENNITAEDKKSSKKFSALNGSTAFIDKDLYNSYRDGALKKLGVKLLPKVDWAKQKNGAKMTAEFISSTVFILSIFKEDMNDDGSLPVERVYAMWKYMKEAGIINIGYCCKKFAAVRNTLTRLNLINWVDHNYTFTTDPNKKGEACKWSITDKLNEYARCRISFNSLFGSPEKEGHTCEEIYFPANSHKYLKPTLILKLEVKQQYSVAEDEIWQFMMSSAA